MFPHSHCLIPFKNNLPVKKKVGSTSRVFLPLPHKWAFALASGRLLKLILRPCIKALIQLLSWTRVFVKLWCYPKPPWDLYWLKKILCPNSLSSIFPESKPGLWNPCLDSYPLPTRHCLMTDSFPGDLQRLDGHHVCSRRFPKGKNMMVKHNCPDGFWWVARWSIKMREREWETEELKFLFGTLIACFDYRSHSSSQ